MGYGECRCFQLWLLLPMCYSLLTTDCVVSSWRRSVRAWRVCSTASSCPRGSRCRPRHVMFVVRLLCPGWPRTCRTRQTSRWSTARTRWGVSGVSIELCLIPGHCISKRFSVLIIQYRHLQFIGTDLKTSLFVLSMVWFQITLCLSNLMLTGSATPFLHNGILPCLYTEESNFDFGEGKVGVKRL